MDERHIATQDALDAADTGEVIERYPSGRSIPNELVLGWVDSGPLRVVLSYSEDGKRAAVLTAYPPDPTRWQPDFKRRLR